MLTNSTFEFTLALFFPICFPSSITSLSTLSISVTPELRARAADEGVTNEWAALEYLSNGTNSLNFFLINFKQIRF